MTEEGTVLFAYSGGTVDEASVTEGETVHVLDTSDPEWTLIETDDGRSGYVPANYIEVKAKPAPKPKPSNSRWSAGGGSNGTNGSSGSNGNRGIRKNNSTNTLAAGSQRWGGSSDARAIPKNKSAMTLSPVSESMAGTSPPPPPKPTAKKTGGAGSGGGGGGGWKPARNPGRPPSGEVVRGPAVRAKKPASATAVGAAVAFGSGGGRGASKWGGGGSGGSNGSGPSGGKKWGSGSAAPSGGGSKWGGGGGTSNGSGSRGGGTSGGSKWGGGASARGGGASGGGPGRGVPAKPAGTVSPGGAGNYTNYTGSDGVTVKIYMGGQGNGADGTEIRVIVIPPRSGFSDLKFAVEAKAAVSSVTMRYQDEDGDMVSMTTDNDLREALGRGRRLKVYL